MAHSLLWPSALTTLHEQPGSGHSRSNRTSNIICRFCVGTSNTDVLAQFGANVGWLQHIC